MISNSDYPEYRWDAVQNIFPRVLGGGSDFSRKLSRTHKNQQVTDRTSYHNKRAVFLRAGGVLHVHRQGVVSKPYLVLFTYFIFFYNSWFFCLSPRRPASCHHCRHESAAAIQLLHPIIWVRQTLPLLWYRIQYAERDASFLTSPFWHR